MGNVCGCANLDDEVDVKPGKENSATPTPSQTELALASASQELAKGAQDCFLDHYKQGRLIGHGAFAKVMVCTHIVSNKKFAVKVVAKDYDDPLRQREGIVKEVAIMRLLQEHPNVVRLLEVFEDRQSYYLVMELCEGGELFEQIIAKGHFSEKAAADLMYSLLDFIRLAHSKNIIHRDLKPENLLLTTKGDDAVLKVIDFGTSDFCEPGQRLTQKFGTPYYVAPEVLQRDYDKSADIWSAGVILYILLCGYPPFAGKTDAKILAKVQEGSYNFHGKEWQVVRPEAKDMVSQMLVKDTTHRATAVKLLQHPWFKVSATAPAAALGVQMLKRLRAFAGMTRMKRLALVVLARTVTDRDVAKLRQLFIATDGDNDGRIGHKDLQASLERVGAAIDEEEMAELFAASDIDGTGLIDYEEFIAAMLDTSRVSRRAEVVRQSFDHLDHDGDGYITPEDLLKALPRHVSIEVAREMVSEVDKDRDGRVGFTDFKHMMEAS